MIYLIPIIGFQIFSWKDRIFISSIYSRGFMSNSLLAASILIVVIWLTAENFGQISDIKRKIPRYKVIIALALRFITISFVSDELLFFFIAFETSLYFLFLSVITTGASKDKLWSNSLMLIVNMFGSIILFISLKAIELNNFTLTITPLRILSPIKIFSDLPIYCIRIILFLKLPLYLFHYWLPQAHVRASSVGSAILAGVVLKLGSIGVYKIYLALNSLSFINKITGSIGLLGLLRMCLFIIRHFDIKILVALSSVLHMSIIPYCWYSQTQTGFIISFFCIIGHRVISPLIFFFVGRLYELSGSRTEELISSSERVDSKYSYMTLITFLINFGIPPFINFLREVLIVSCMIQLYCLGAVIISLAIILSMIIFIIICSFFLSGKKNIVHKKIGSEIFVGRIFIAIIWVNLFLTAIV